MDFEKEVDKPGNIVHGSYLENLPRILRAGGLKPSASLPDDLIPIVYYMRKRLGQVPRWIASPNCPYVSVVELFDQYGNKFNFRRNRLWNGDTHSFHFYIVSNHPFRDLGASFEELAEQEINPREYDKPHYYQGTEIALYRQSIPLDTFVAIVVPTDEMIIQGSQLRECGHIFQTKYGGTKHTMTAEEIATRVQAKFVTHTKRTIPIFDVNGNLLSE